ncbi:MAG TPA: acyltransferase [Bacteroidia bacterium]|jgi:peptidoglycan/LPS O-acetylase OafA/YrhL|nr:acyltransferase [Bacteroidia bacterium]
MNIYPKTYFNNLDAPRFLAFILVFLQHIIYTRNQAILGSPVYKFYDDHFHIGHVGWDFYIVLSGFLITWMILEEYNLTSGFNLFNFWLKRCLRIWPLYFFLILMGFLLVWAARNFLGNRVSDIPPLSWLLSFTLNFYIVKHGQNFLFFLVFLWSLSVGEQFYFAWGILFKWFKKAFVPFCVLLLTGSLVFRYYALHDSQNLHFNTLSWVGNFAGGSLIAYLCMNRGKVFQWLKKTPVWLIAAIYTMLLLNLAFYKVIYSSDIMTVVERLSATLFFGFMIFEQSFCEKHLFELGKIPKLNYLGKISYGLFCYHGLIILFYEQSTQQLEGINSPWAVFLINPVVIFVLTIGVSALSYEYIEKPIMSLRRQLQIA